MVGGKTAMASARQKRYTSEGHGQTPPNPRQVLVKIPEL